MPDKQTSLIKNILALYSLQGLQYLIPLVSLPWLIHSLGTAGYGLLSLAIAFGSYFQLITDYGFNLSATRKIALANRQPERLGQIVSTVLLAKLLLASIASVALLIVALCVPSLRLHGLALLVGCLGSLASSFFPYWLFQGMDMMVRVSQISIGTKILQLALWVALVHRPEHVLRALSINLAIAVFSTSISWLLASRSLRLRLRPVSIGTLMHELREGLEVFLSMLGAVAFTNSNVLLLGAFATPHALGLYCIAEKIARAAIGLVSPVITALFPRLGAMFAESPTQAIAFLRSITPRISLLFASVSAALALLAPIAAGFARVAPKDIAEVASLIRILSPLPLTIFLDNIFGTQILLNLDKRRAFLNGILGSCLLSISTQIALIPLWGAQGAATSLLCAGIWNLAYFAWQSRKLTGFPGRAPFRD